MKSKLALCCLLALVACTGSEPQREAPSSASSAGPLARSPSPSERLAIDASFDPVFWKSERLYRARLDGSAATILPVEPTGTSNNYPSEATGSSDGPSISTSPGGRFVQRKFYRRVDVAPADKPARFVSIVDGGKGDEDHIHGFVFARDDSLVAWVERQIVKDDCVDCELANYRLFTARPDGSAKRLRKTIRTREFLVLHDFDPAGFVYLNEALEGGYNQKFRKVRLSDGRVDFLRGLQEEGSYEYLSFTANFTKAYWLDEAEVVEHDVSTGKRTPLFRLPANSGEARLTSLHLSPDAKRIVFSAGELPQRRGWIAYRMELPRGKVEEISTLKDVAGLTTTSLSPDGKLLWLDCSLNCPGSTGGSYIIELPSRAAHPYSSDQTITFVGWLKQER